MKNKRLTITITVLVLMLVFISVGYAAYSTVLRIGGVAKVNRSVWSIHYDKDSVNVLNGTDQGYTLVSPTVGPTVDSDQTNLSFETELNLNEETSFTIDVVNDGTFTARVNSVNIVAQSKTENDANYTTLSNINSNRWSNDYLDFYVVWTDGNKNILDTIDLEPATTKNMTVVVRYKQPENQNLLPSENMDFKFNIDVEYTQVDNMNNSTAVKPKVTESVASAADFVNALENHSDDNVVLRINEDIDLTSYDVIEIKNNTIIEFNGHTLTVAPNSIKAVNEGVLTLEDSTGKGGITADRGVIVVADGGTLIVNGGTYKTTNYTRGSGINAKDGAKIIFNNGVIDAAYYAIGSDGTIDVTINGGELKSTATKENGTWAYCVSIANGKFAMNGGKITGVHGGLALNGTTEGVINNGEILVHESQEGVNDAFYDIYMEGTPSLKVYNGKFNNVGTRSVIYTASSNDAELYGGTYIAKGTTLFTGNNIKVSGGTFSHDVSNYVISGTLSLDEATSLYKMGA